MTLAKIFHTGMILQREMAVRIWGEGEPEEKIQVTVQGKQVETHVEADGKWSLCLPALEASCGETMLVQGEKEEIRIEDIAVGEVFVAAGQSNMEFWMRYEKHYQEMLITCENHDIRFYDMPKLAYEGQENDFDYHNVGIWRKASKENLEYFSSVGYYFAKKLEKDISVPIGIIGCNWGGTRSLAWMKEKHAREIQKRQTADFEEKLKGKNYEEFCQTAGNNPLNDTGNSTWDSFNEFILPETPSEEEIQVFFSRAGNPGQNMDTAKPQNAPGALYQHMVKRLAPYTIRGVLWYQGESDDEIDGTQKNYKAALDAIKQDWRDAWNQPALPFFVVQLPGFYSWFGCICKGFPVIRECQQQSVDEDVNAYLCSVSDSGEEFDIHPKEKINVGKRLALLAEKHLFGKDIIADPPRLKNIRREKRNIILSFENADGLYVDGDKLNSLEVFEGEKETPYTFVVSGEQIILNLPEEINSMVTVKFARDVWYQVNLYNQGRIPAIPFEVSC